MNRDQLLDLYRVMVTARQIDRVEQELTQRGEAFFHLSGAGHEATAVLAPLLTDDDWLHCHYRSRALLLARGIAPRSFFDNLFCNDGSSSRGRRMSAFFSEPRRNVLSMVTPVGNNALQAVGVAEAVAGRPGRPIVLCGIGDGTTQQGEFMEACGEAARRQLPVLFLVEDNGWAISTPTREKTFYSLSPDQCSDFQGLPVHCLDGRDVVQAHDRLEQIVTHMRHTREPALVVFQVERLASHSNADDQTVYRSAAQLAEAAETGDPILLLQRHLLASGCDPGRLQTIREQVVAEISAAEAEAIRGPEPQATRTAKCPLPVELTHPSQERRGEENGQRLTMRDALQQVLRHQLQTDPRVVLFGEDIEDPKGDVFGVTKGLSREFPQRMRNSPLSESTIIGVSIGRALAGQRPVAFLQFADFLPLAYNQLVSELGAMRWRTAGQWNAPVITMVACGAYRPGLGPYHAQTLEAVMAHAPGLDVFMPSTAADAAGLLNAAFQSGRPTLFFYPKSLLNDSQGVTSEDVEQQFVPIGPARKVRAGRDLTLVCWGNTVRLCEQAARALEKAGIESEVLDLRSLSPWDERAVLASAEKTARLIVAHEDNHTCGMGGEILATVAEKARMPVALRRVTRPDTFVPCNFANQLELLPSLKTILATAAELLDLDLSWVPPQESEDGICYVEAIGSAPSDDTVVVVEVTVEPGAAVQRGDIVASLEASKSVFELTSPVSGQLDEILVSEGETVAVGTPLLKVRTQESTHRKRPAAQQQPGTPVLVQRPGSQRLLVPRQPGEPRPLDVGISTVATVEGGRVVLNADLAACRDHHTVQDVLRRTGIERRHWVTEQENAVSLAVRACQQLLDAERLIVDDLDLLVCSTTSPTSVTPSMACQVLNQLAGQKGESLLQAYDINAACSGYLYALQAGYDYLQSEPYGRVLLVTSEVLSPLLDPTDFDTAILFGDAASATVLYGEGHFQQACARLHRPDLLAKGDAGGALSVPLLHDGFIQMRGRKVFTEAVRAMVASLSRVCRRQSLNVDDLKLVVPHQANQRILDAIQNRIQPQVFSNIRQHGNTSSSSIPLCLAEVFPAAHQGDRLGLCAFGGGFTFGASILEMN